MHSPSTSEMPVWRTRIAGVAPRWISRIQEAKSRDHEPQTHYGDAGSHPSEKRPLVSENLSFDLIRVEPPLFVLSIGRFVRRAYPSSIRFAHRTRPCARGRGKC